jgi:hypothetical protein
MQKERKPVVRQSDGLVPRRACEAFEERSREGYATKQALYIKSIN